MNLYIRIESYTNSYILISVHAYIHTHIKINISPFKYIQQMKANGALDDYIEQDSTVDLFLPLANDLFYIVQSYIHISISLSMCINIDKCIYVHICTCTYIYIQTDESKWCS
jgi:hypothetical protein